MEFANPFTAPGRWYRGNLHTHTTVSDGALTPEETAAAYRRADYDFLALTDHRTVAELADPPAGLLMLLGAELHGDRCDAGEEYHVVGFGLDRAAEAPSRVEAV